MCTHYAQSCQYFPVKHCVAPGVASNDGVVRYTVVLNRLLSVFKVSRECQNVKKKKKKKKKTKKKTGGFKKYSSFLQLLNNGSLRLALLMSLSVFWCVILVVYFTILAQLYQLMINIRYSLLAWIRCETGDYSSIWFVLTHSHMFTLALETVDVFTIPWPFL